MTEKEFSSLERLRRVLDRLLDPKDGCPWDLKQTPSSVRGYLLEETYELLDAIEAGDSAGIKEELGDCLFILCFLARFYEQDGLFSVNDALDTAAAKLIARHPHVFADGRKLNNDEEVKIQWHEIKRQEKKGALLQSVPKNMPALMRAHRLTEKVGKVGFDWPDPAAVLETLGEEIAEFKQAWQGGNQERIGDELGDILFTVANLSRHLKVNAEEALTRTNNRFQRRFGYVEERLTGMGKTLEEASLGEMDELWAEAKSRES